jgi:hypothetical protein
MVGADDVKVAVSVGVNVTLGVWVWVGVDISSIVGVGDGNSVFSGPPVAVTTMNCEVTADCVEVVRLHAIAAAMKTVSGNHRMNWKIRMFIVVSIPCGKQNRALRDGKEKAFLSYFPQGYYGTNDAAESTDCSPLGRSV